MSFQSSEHSLIAFAHQKPGILLLTLPVLCQKCPQVIPNYLLNDVFLSLPPGPAGPHSSLEPRALFAIFWEKSLQQF
jgi:hypothetical protein